MDAIRAWHSLILSLKLILFKHEADLHMLNVSQASYCLRLISSLFPHKDPWNLHFPWLISSSIYALILSLIFANSKIFPFQYRRRVTFHRFFDSFYISRTSCIVEGRLIAGVTPRTTRTAHTSPGMLHTKVLNLISIRATQACCRATRNYAAAVRGLSLSRICRRYELLYCSLTAAPTIH